MQRASPKIRPHPYLLWPLVCVGIMAISFASILIRLADAPSLTIATYRVGLATLILAPYFSLRSPMIRPKWNGRLLGATVLSGFFLALHFAFWVRSLQMTSVASSTTLVSTTPLFLAIIPQLIGHTTFNWTLRFFSPTTVAVLILGEPIGATILAYLYFGEMIPLEKALGLLILGAGIVLSAEAPSLSPING
jgi:drug/metabolite transporter (DMT)-like permease